MQFPCLPQLSGQEESTRGLSTSRIERVKWNESAQRRRLMLAISSLEAVAKQTRGLQGVQQAAEKAVTSQRFWKQPNNRRTISIWKGQGIVCLATVTMSESKRRTAKQNKTKNKTHTQRATEEWNGHEFSKGTKLKTEQNGTVVQLRKSREIFFNFS